MVSMAPQIRNATRKPSQRYECRVVRTVERDQPDLSRPLRQLQENTNNFITYKWNEPGKELGRLGVTLVMLEPVLRQILGSNRHGTIRREELTIFEAELRDGMSHAQFSNYDIPLQQFEPLALYGRHRQYLGLQLARSDYRMVADRAMVEQYIRDNYDRADGQAISRRFLARNLMRIEPHVTIGEVDYTALTAEQGRALRADPSQFVFDEAYARMEANEQEFGSDFAAQPIIFPEDVTLNGLRIFTQQRQ